MTKEAIPTWRKIWCFIAVFNLCDGSVVHHVQLLQVGHLALPLAAASSWTHLGAPGQLDSVIHLFILSSSSTNRNKVLPPALSVSHCASNKYYSTDLYQWCAPLYDIRLTINSQNSKVNKRRSTTLKDHESWKQILLHRHSKYDKDWGK